MVVVSNTTPLHYLVLIEVVDVLHSLYGRVVIPPAVASELSHPVAPEQVRTWITRPPAWLEVVAEPVAADTDLARLDAGEREAIALFQARSANLLLMDDREGVRAARSRGVEVIGTLGVLDRAAEHRLVDLPSVLNRLEHTTFRTPSAIIRLLLEQDAERQRGRR